MQQFLEGLLTILRGAANYTVPFMAICTFLVFVIKPIRVSVHNLFKKIANTDEIHKKIDALLSHDAAEVAQLRLHEAIHLSSLKNRITNVYYKYIDSDNIPIYEKQNLAEQYRLYKELGGNGFLDSLYEELMEKKSSTSNRRDGG